MHTIHRGVLAERGMADIGTVIPLDLPVVRDLVGYTIHPELARPFMVHGSIHRGLLADRDTETIGGTILPDAEAVPARAGCTIRPVPAIALHSSGGEIVCCAVGQCRFVHVLCV